MTKVSNLPNHYSCLEDLTLYRWDKYVQTKDNNWFLVDYDGREKKLICDELKEVENKLVDDYFKLVDDRGFSLKMQKWAKIDSLRTKYHVVGRLLERFEEIIEMNDAEYRYKYIVALGKWGFKIDPIQSVAEDFNRVQELKQALQGIGTQIGILSNELKDEGRKESQSLAKQLQIATIGLNYPHRLDAKTISVADWIEICKLLEEKSKLN